MSPLPLPPVPEPYRVPFHYGALHMVGLDFLVDPGPVRALLGKHHPALAAAEFEGSAVVSVNYQLYFAQYPGGGGITQEIEVNLLAHPADAADRLPELTYRQYAHGWERTGLTGIARIHVLCDNPLAIDAGRRLYAEPKYPGSFDSLMPSPNGPEDGRTWRVDCRDGSGPLLSFEVDLTDRPSAVVNHTPITGYGTTAEGRALAGPMAVHHPGTWYDLEGTGTRLALHAPDSPVGQDLAALLGDTPATAAWAYQSPPVAAHQRPYYLPTR
ncbi:hypothetical protein [Kitasatospora sp. NPDC004289]